MLVATIVTICGGGVDEVKPSWNIESYTWICIGSLPLDSEKHPAAFPPLPSSRISTSTSAHTQLKFHRRKPAPIAILQLTSKHWHALSTRFGAEVWLVLSPFVFHDTECAVVTQLDFHSHTGIEYSSCAT